MTNRANAGWETKVHGVIAKLSYAAWRTSNYKDGNRYRRHRPYALPDEARALVDALGMNDRFLAELKAKSVLDQLRRAGTDID